MNPETLPFAVAVRALAGLHLCISQQLLCCERALDDVWGNLLMPGCAGWQVSCLLGCGCVLWQCLSHLCASKSSAAMAGVDATCQPPGREGSGRSAVLCLPLSASSCGCVRAGCS